MEQDFASPFTTVSVGILKPREQFPSISATSALTVSASTARLIASIDALSMLISSISSGVASAIA
jgi:hypothetical protein